MTTDSAQAAAPQETRPTLNRGLRNMKIWMKLTIGLGTLAALTILVVLISYLASAGATQKISRTDDLRVPAALASQRAQTDLLRMLAATQAYLVLGEQEYRGTYGASADAMNNDLAKLDGLSDDFDAADKARLAQLKTTFGEWTKLPNQLFDLRDNQLDREPAYKILATDGLLLAGTVLIDTNKLIDQQSVRSPSADNTARLGDMARFQGTFAAMLSGLRGYVTTRNRTFRGEFQANLDANNLAWDTLYSHRASLTPEQQATLEEMSAKRVAFLKLPDQIFSILESDRWRQDLYLFKTQAVPLAGQMATLLDQITADQQSLLQSELTAGRVELANARWATLAAGLLAIILGLATVIRLRDDIGGPIVRLTRVAEQVRSGDLAAQAAVESGDEVGTLAETFNRMTRQLRRTLLQTRREKKRADDLLTVVIPIGIQLSAEKDLDRLLENIVIQTKTFCHANGGVLYLRNAEGHLQPIVLRDDRLQLALGGTTGQPIPYESIPLDDPMHSLAVRAAWFGTTVNVPDAVPAGATNYISPAFADDPYANNTSFLGLPLKSSQGQVMGLLQLTGALDPDTGQIVPFDSQLQQMMESFSSLAAAALEAYLREQGLQQQIQQLRIEIDEVKRQKQVSEIVETDFFQNLQSKARVLRERSQQPKPQESGDAPA